MKTCRHNWDYLTVLWMAGLRAHPCKKCSEILSYGTVTITEKAGS